MNDRLDSRGTQRRSDETALYFPYIRVPQSSWFTQVLLYWDTAASIVPTSLVKRPGGLPPYMHELHHYGLLDFVDPDHALDHCDMQAFNEAFLDLVDRAKLAPAPEKRTYAKVHIDKMSHGLGINLCRQGLALPEIESDPAGGSWRLVETTTAQAFMKYLAGVISANMGNALPVTDQLDDLAGPAPTTDGTVPRLAELRYAVIDRALPAPQGEVPVDEIVKFKDEHAQELKRCRRYLDKQLAKIASDYDPDGPREIWQANMNWAMQEIEEDVADLKQAMEKRRWPKVTLVGFGGVTAALLGAAATLLTSGSALLLGLAVAGNILQFGSATHDAVEMMREQRFDRRAPLAYAALAAHRFG